MLTHLLNLLFFIGYALATATTYNLSFESHWNVSGLSGANPSIDANVGDVLTFAVTGLSTTVFAIHHTLGSTSSLDRVPTSPASLTGAGALTLNINSGYGGMVLYYTDESNPLSSTGRICVSLDHCTTMTGCGGTCTACASGWSLTVGGTCGMNAGVTCPTPLPVPYCATANCWVTSKGLQAQCSTCVGGYYINSALTCNACSLNCNVGQYISSPCGVYNDRVCSSCSPCPPGSVMSAPCPGTGTTDDTSCVNSGPPSTTPPPPSTNPPPSVTPSPPATLNTTCPPPLNCKSSTCWSKTDSQCTECNRGFFLDNAANSSCTTCSQCAMDKYISWPCEGYTDTVCSQCYSEACHPCQVGYSMDLSGLCVGQLCLLYGCGASNVDVVCKESDASHFLCVCPGEVATVVPVNGTGFAGCSSDNNNPPPVSEIIARVNATHLEAFLVNGMEQILGAALVTVNGNSFTLNVTATIPIDGLTQELQNEIAKFLGGSYTPADVTIQFVGRKRGTVSNGEVSVTVQGESGVAACSVPFASWVLVGIVGLVLSMI